MKNTKTETLSNGTNVTCYFGGTRHTGCVIVPRSYCGGRALTYLVHLDIGFDVELPAYQVKGGV